MRIMRCIVYNCSTDIFCGSSITFIYWIKMAKWLSHQCICYQTSVSASCWHSLQHLITIVSEPGVQAVIMSSHTELSTFWNYKALRECICPPSEFFYSFCRGVGGRWCPVKTECLSQAVFEITGLNDIGITTVTLEGHVTSSMTSSFDSPQAISCWWVIGTKSLSQTVFEIFASKYECSWTDTHMDKNANSMSASFTPFTWRT